VVVFSVTAALRGVSYPPLKRWACQRTPVFHVPVRKPPRHSLSNGWLSQVGSGRESARHAHHHQNALRSGWHARASLLRTSLTLGLADGQLVSPTTSGPVRRVCYNCDAPKQRRHDSHFKTASSICYSPTSYSGSKGCFHGYVVWLTIWAAGHCLDNLLNWRSSIESLMRSVKVIVLYKLYQPLTDG